MTRQQLRWMFMGWLSSAASALWNVRHYNTDNKGKQFFTERQHQKLQKAAAMIQEVFHEIRKDGKP